VASTSSTSTPAAPATVALIPRSLVQLAAAAGVAIAVAAVMWLVFDPWYLNYDARYALLWAGDLWNGDRPDYDTPFAPTPHPLQTAVGFVIHPFGASDQLLTWIVLISFGVLGWLVYRLGAQLFSPWAGLVAAVAVLTRPALERDALLAYQDIPFAALIVGAVLIEARRPRRGLPVFVLLAVAGLLRPEAWFLSGLYFLYMWPAVSNRTRVLFAALTAIAPLIWMLSDLLIAHDALHSLHGTAELADEQDRRRHIHQVPYWTLQYFGFTLREPLVVGVPVGLAFAWLYRRRAGTLPVVVALAMTLVFAIGPLFGLPLIGRYLRTPAILMSLFYGLAVCGWALLPQGRARRGWFYAGMLALALSVAFLPRHFNMLEGLDNRIERDGRLYADLRGVGTALDVRAVFNGCGSLSVADHRPMPYLRYWLEGKPGSVQTIEKGASPLGPLLVVPRPVPHVKRFYRENFPRVTVPRGYRKLYTNDSWSVYWRSGSCTFDRLTGPLS
jgi:hypothetical protein